MLSEVPCSRLTICLESEKFFLSARTGKLCLKYYEQHRLLRESALATQCQAMQRENSFGFLLLYFQESKS